MNTLFWWPYFPIPLLLFMLLVLLLTMVLVGVPVIGDGICWVYEIGDSWL